MSQHEVVAERSGSAARDDARAADRDDLLEHRGGEGRADARVHDEHRRAGLLDEEQGVRSDLADDPADPARVASFGERLDDLLEEAQDRDIGGAAFDVERHHPGTSADDPRLLEVHLEEGQVERQRLVCVGVGHRRTLPT